MIRLMRRGFWARRGNTQVEFALVAVQLFLVIFAAVEFCRMVLVYTNIANAARVGARYAITHGSKRTGTGPNGPSGPGNNPPEILSVIRDYARGGLLDPSDLQITVTYPQGFNDPGYKVHVRVTYLYKPLTLLPIGATLGSETQGVITF